MTENLFDALAQLRPTSGVSFLWIDALYINQNDFKERADQVLLMGKIYSLSVEVLIWLGKQNLYFKDFLWATTIFLPKLEDLAKLSGWEAIYASSPLEAALGQRLGNRGLERKYNRMRYFS